MHLSHSLLLMKQNKLHKDKELTRKIRSFGFKVTLSHSVHIHKTFPISICLFQSSINSWTSREPWALFVGLSFGLANIFLTICTSANGSQRSLLDYRMEMTAFLERLCWLMGTNLFDTEQTSQDIILLNFSLPRSIWETLWLETIILWLCLFSEVPLDNYSPLKN